MISLVPAGSPGDSTWHSLQRMDVSRLVAFPGVPLRHRARLADEWKWDKCGFESGKEVGRKRPGGGLRAAREATTGGRDISVGTHIILVTGAKGGVGTSTVALNLSVQIAQTTRQQVVLLDYARPFGQIALMLSIDPRFTLLDALGRIDRLDEKLLASMVTKHRAGVAVLAGALHAPLRQEQRQSVTIEALTRLLGIAAGAFDSVVVDMGFVNGAEWAPVLREAASIVLVSEPSELAMGMLGRYLDTAEAAGLDPGKFEIVINRWRQNDQDAWKDIERELKRPVISRLPNDYRQLTEAVKMGMPLMASSHNPLVARYRDLAAQLTSTSETNARMRAPVTETAPASAK